MRTSKLTVYQEAYQLTVEADDVKIRLLKKRRIAINGSLHAFMVSMR